MPDTPITRTNNVPRLLIDGFELTLEERAEFDYLDWDDIEDGGNMATFLRYRGRLYDLGEFQTTRRLPEFSPLRQWDGYHADSFFSAIVVRYCDDPDYVVVGTVVF